jgi:nicotinate phosphoribosyltransferase
VRILASGDLDEYVIAGLIADGVPIDGFGVGTRMGTSEDAPSVGVVYKLVADDRGPKLKLSEGKATLPGRKQINRTAEYDVLCLDNEPSEGRNLLAPVVVSGTRLTAPPALPEMQERCASAIGALPPRLRSLEAAVPLYEVRVSARLQALVDDLTAAHRIG